MNRPFTALLLATLCMLAGCASRPTNALAVRQRALAARQRAYERLASFIEPGMTRRQLYALLPPRRTPTFVASSISNVHGSMPDNLLGLMGGCSEDHPLDDDFQLDVSYWHTSSRRHPAIPASRSNVIPITPGSIDTLLRGHPIGSKTYLSKQNPDDVLFSRPIVVRNQGLPSQLVIR